MANIELRVRGQRLLVNRGYVVAGTVRYLTIKAAFSDDWRGREVWAYLEFGDKKYKTQLDANGESKSRAGLNLSAGEWSIYIMGYGKDASERRFGRRAASGRRGGRGVAECDRNVYMRFHKR